MKFFLESRSLLLALPSQDPGLLCHGVCGKQRSPPKKFISLISDVKLDVRDAIRLTIKSDVITNKVQME